MIWELVVWLIFFGFFLGAILVVHYWYDLLRTRDQYRREELIDIGRILQDRFLDLMGRGDALMNYAGLLVGVAVAWLLTLIGGFFSQSQPGMADHASGQITNYFFQSALFPAILHITWPSLRDVFEQQGGPLRRLLDAENLLFIGLTVGLAAVHVATWGVYHHMNFLWNLGNMCLCLVYAGYRVDLALNRPDENYGADNYDDEYGDDDYGRDAEYGREAYGSDDAGEAGSAEQIDPEMGDVPEYPFDDDK